jgi:hypothetical protein
MHLASVERRPVLRLTSQSTAAPLHIHIWRPTIPPLSNPLTATKPSRPLAARPSTTWRPLRAPPPPPRHHSNFLAAHPHSTIPATPTLSPWSTRSPHGAVARWSPPGGRLAIAPRSASHRPRIREHSADRPANIIQPDHDPWPISVGDPPSVRERSANHRRTIAQPSANHRPPISQRSATLRPTLGPSGDFPRPEIDPRQPVGSPFTLADASVAPGHRGVRTNGRHRWTTRWETSC